MSILCIGTQIGSKMFSTDVFMLSRHLAYVLIYFIKMLTDYTYRWSSMLTLIDLLGEVILYGGAMWLIWKF